MFKRISQISMAILMIALIFSACNSDRSNVVNGNDIDFNIKNANGSTLYPEDLLYSDHHEWVKIDGNDAIVGITQFAADKFTSVTFFENGITEDEEDLIMAGPKPKPDTAAKAKGEKLVWPILAPVGGLHGGSNPLLDNDPDLMRRDPYGNGWCVRINNFNIEDLNYLMNSVDYEAYIETIEE